MKFKNKKGKDLKTTMSSDTMNKMSDIVEEELKIKGIMYLRDGTKFSVNPNDISTLFDAQINANLKLIERGVITSDMILKDIKSIL